MDLRDFACQTVSISFALATADYNISEFSPPMILEVQNSKNSVKV